MPGFLIQNGTHLPGLQVFVSAFTKGNDKWFDLPGDFEDYNAAHWERSGSEWEVIVVRDPVTEERRGWYVQALPDGVKECTFMGFDKEMEFSSRF